MVEQDPEGLWPADEPPAAEEDKCSGCTTTIGSSCCKKRMGMWGDDNIEFESLEFRSRESGLEF